MNLFAADRTVNLLPCEGTVNYYGPIFSPDEASWYFATLLAGVSWRNDEAVLFGKRITTARKVAWYGDESFSYTYSRTTRQALPWTAELQNLRSIVEQVTDTRYNSCLLNLYHNGNEGVGWHSDDEKCLVENAPIASLSFGAERTFRFKHKQTGRLISVVLENGSLLLMSGAIQKHWLHSLPKSKTILTTRINLTFRRMGAG